jgi:hypothetical protein
MTQELFDANLATFMQGHSSTEKDAIETGLQTCFATCKTQIEAATADAKKRTVLLGRVADYLYRTGEEVTSNLKALA